jgi:GT2 family glycosyltransferase
MNTPLLIVTCTQSKTEEEFQQQPIYKSLKKQYESNSPRIDFQVFKDNKRGLSECYNEVLRNPSNKNKIVLFVHDDIELEDIFLYEKLANSPYSITGLAGAKSFHKQSNKLAWHLSAPKEHYVGEVAHIKDGAAWTTCFGPTNSRALTIDGLFIACKVNDLLEKGVEFDENFNFHFYDIAFCLRANEKKVTCGVLPIRVIHHGLGDSMLTPDWEETNLKFKQHYCK